MSFAGTIPKTVWIVNQYASTPRTGIGGRSFYIGRELARRGHDVSIIAGSASHLLRVPPETSGPVTIDESEGVKMVWLRLSSYQKSRSLVRTVNWFRFALALRVVPATLGQFPDIVICSSPSLISFLGAERLARRTGAALIFEARDIWPLTLVEIGSFSTTHPFIRFLQWIEDRALVRADMVISNLKHADDHFVKRGMARGKFRWRPNGVDFAESGRVRAVPAGLFDRIPPGRFLVGYAGTLGEANALETLIDAAERLTCDNNIHIVIVGDGRLKADLQAKARNAGLDNVTFIGPVSKSVMPAVLAHFDTCYVGARKLSLYRYGVAMNKLPEYMSAARPVIYAIDSGPYWPVREAACGLEVAPEDPDELAAAIRQLGAMPETERAAMGERGRSYARSLFDYRAIAIDLENDFMELCEHR